MAVARLVLRRTDAPGALVALADRRYALTGPLIAVGPPRQMRRFLRRRTALARERPEQIWLHAASLCLDADLRDQERPLL
ncbi:hypothetical protein Q5424_11490 [Conexibacter sp. JD483]|uniref:hypothetical protein n=1 Tax=unclassified Conexibacter TaxID=2627773 RepID=UPI002726737F|nr:MULTISPECIES: hypothetical protein [unclassified Conexibacter]MDO8187968.1 hypothetical protein [Conexibacter sp. CPCC 205706]MDO8200163.1 hypothetical protein [Conexibacter sp. CPCC 205762]MDR9369709.1 hypothetical protein [Conexibacter sp. JD483]